MGGESESTTGRILQHRREQSAQPSGQQPRLEPDVLSRAPDLPYPSRKSGQQSQRSALTESECVVSCEWENPSRNAATWAACPWSGRTSRTRKATLTLSSARRECVAVVLTDSFDILLLDTEPGRAGQLPTAFYGDPIQELQAPLTMSTALHSETEGPPEI